MKERVFLVTGGAGFIGSHLVDLLAAEGHRVAVIDDLSAGCLSNINPAAKFYKANIEDPGISKIFEKEKPDFVFHLAAQRDVGFSITNPITESKINILGTLNILENSVKNKVKKIIFSSTAGIYGDTDIIPTPEECSKTPLSPYSINKLAIENYLQYYYLVKGLNYAILRPANVYGPRQSNNTEGGAVAIFINNLLHGKSPTINGDGSQTRDYVYVKDAARAFVSVQNNDFCGALNIGTGTETSTNELYAKIVQKTKKNIAPIHGCKKPGELNRSCLSWDRAKKYLKWNPEYDLNSGLEETIKWFIDKG